MNILPITTRVYLAECLLAGCTMSASASAAATGKMTMQRFVEKLGKGCDRLLDDLMMVTPRRGLSLDEDAFRFGQAANKSAMPTFVTMYLDEHSLAVVGLGYGIDAASAADEGRAAVSRRTVDATYDGAVRSTAHRPAKIKAALLKQEATGRALLWLFAAHYNLCAIGATGDTPAMRLGISEEPWTTQQLVLAALEHHDPMPPPSPTLIVPPRRVEPPPLVVPRELERHPYRGELLTLAEISVRSGKPVKAIHLGMRAGRTAEDASMRPHERIVGKEYDRLTVRSVVVVSGKGDHRWICTVECKCKAVKEVTFNHLRSGKVTSCGCAHLETITKGTAPTLVTVFGQEMSIGALAALVHVKPATIWARMRKGTGLSAEEAAFGKHGAASAAE